MRPNAQIFTMAEVGPGLGLGMEVMWREEAGPVVLWIAGKRREGRLGFVFERGDCV